MVLVLSANNISATYDNFEIREVSDLACTLTNVATTDWYDYSQSRIDVGIIAGFETSKGIPIGYFSEIASTNVARWNRDFTQGSVWLLTNAPSATKDQIGIDGRANSCSLLTDDSANAESFYQDYVIVNDSAIHTQHAYIRRDTDISRFPEIQLDCVSGTAQRIATQLNTQTGVLVDRSVTGTATSKSELVHLGGFEWWKVTLTVQNNTSGNTVLRFRLYPSATDVQNTWNSNATGSIIVDAVQVELNKAFPTSTIFTEGSAVTRNKDGLDYPTVHLPTNDFEGECAWTPTANSQGIIVIVGTNVDTLNHTLIYHDGTNLRWRKKVSSTVYDVITPMTYVAGTTYNIRWGLNSVGGMELWIDGVKGANNSNTLDCVLGSHISIGNDGVAAYHQTGGINNFKMTSTR